jgi:hypothetical protein
MMTLQPLLHTAEVVPQRLYEQARPSYLRDILEVRRRRRIEIGEHVSISFESRDTVLFQLHEVLRANGSWRPEHVAQAVGDLQHLVPDGETLTATFMLHGGPRPWGRALCERLLAEPHKVVRLRVGDRYVGARQVSPPSHPWCPVHYLSFPIGADSAEGLCDSHVPARLSMRDPHGSYAISLTTATRLELAGDLHPYRHRLGPLP